MSDGILFVGIGDLYRELARCAAKQARKHTDLPIHCIVDRQIGHVPCDTTVEVVRCNQARNREIKTTMYDRSPFDRTVFMDVDSMIQNPGIEQIFEWLDDYPIVVNQCFHWKNKMVQLYKRTMKQLGTEPPIRVFNTAIIGWSNREQKYTTEELFKFWRKYWMQMGSRRDMPAFCCAMKNLGMDKVCKILPKYWWMEGGRNPKAVVQHDYGPKFWRDFNLPAQKKIWKPPTSASDFKWCYWEKPCVTKSGTKSLPVSR